MRNWSSVLADVVAVSVFALVGRRSHGESADLLGLWHTAWPFLAGAALGTLLTRAWRRPGSVTGGVGIWICAVAGGMGLRALTGAGTDPAFVVVATISLAVLLLGWRALAALVRRARVRQSVDA